MTWVTMERNDELYAIQPAQTVYKDDRYCNSDQTFHRLFAPSHSSLRNALPAQSETSDVQSDDSGCPTKYETACRLLS